MIANGEWIPMNDLSEKLNETKTLVAMARHRLDVLDQAMESKDPLSIRIALGDVQVPLRHATKTMSKVDEF